MAECKCVRPAPRAYRAEVWNRFGFHGKERKVIEDVKDTPLLLSENPRSWRKDHELA